MSLLSRVAERLYWTARYLERAETTSRLARVYGNLMLDLPREAGLSWDVLVQITGGGLLEHQHVDAHLIDLQFHLIDRVVLAHNALSKLGVALDQRTHRQHYGFLSSAAHDQQLVAEPVQVFFYESVVHSGSP